MKKKFHRETLNQNRPLGNPPKLIKTALIKPTPNQNLKNSRLQTHDPAIGFIGFIISVAVIVIVLP